MKNLDAARAELVLAGQATLRAEAFSSDKYALYGKNADRTLEVYHLVVAPSYACNLHCSHCYLPHHSSDQLPLSRVSHLVEEWAEVVARERNGRGIFHLKGGEPLVLPYFSDVVTAVQATGVLSLMVTTNGTVHGRTALNALSQFNKESGGQLLVQVSVDGATSATNAVTRGRDSFDRSLRFVRAVRAAGINTHLNFVVHADNVHEIESCMRLAIDEGVAQTNFLTYVPSGFGASMIDRTPDLAEVYNRLTKLFDESDEDVKGVMFGSYPHMVTQHNRDERWMSGGCIAGFRGMAYIVPNGNVYACPNLAHKSLVFGNILEQSLERILKGFPHQTCLQIDQAVASADNRFVCKGERTLDIPGVRGEERSRLVEHLQQAVGQDVADADNRWMECTSHCFSRNL